MLMITAVLAESLYFMEKIRLQARDGASAEIVMHGAHVCSWIPANGQEQLFLSKKSEFGDGVAIRGGVPIVFPQFSNLGTLPKHGFARTAKWQLIRTGQIEQGAAQAVFELKHSAASLAIWPHAFRAELVVTVAEQSLQLDFSVENLGETALQFQSALHTYFQVDNINASCIHGLQGLSYRDTVTNVDGCIQVEEVLTIAAETDRIYTDLIADVLIEQPHQLVQIRQSGFTDAVVWNPWVEKTVQISDLDADAYQRMICVEAASIVKPIVLTPDQVWTGMQLMSVHTK